MTADTQNIRSVQRSHIGSVRRINEDRVFNGIERTLWAVADGMGGHAQGDIAAEHVVACLAQLSKSDAEISVDAIETSLRKANAQIRQLNALSGEASGATVAGLSLTNGIAHIFWAGDSRVYRLRSNILTLLTRDHRLVQDMIDAGAISAAQARAHPQASVITCAVGASDQMTLAIRSEDVAAGDKFLICSDGLSDLVQDTVIQQHLSCDPAVAIDRLVGAALDAGGTDNISAIIVSVGESTATSRKTGCSDDRCITHFS